MRIIDADAFERYMQDEWQNNRLCNDAWITFREALKACPKISTMRWISVKDGLPNLGEDVFIYAVGKANGFEGQHEIATSRRFIFKAFPWTEFGIEKWSPPWRYFDVNYDVTHWAVPELPKEEA